MLNTEYLYWVKKYVEYSSLEKYRKTFTLNSIFFFSYKLHIFFLYLSFKNEPYTVSKHKIITVNGPTFVVGANITEIDKLRPLRFSRI